MIESTPPRLVRIGLILILSLGFMTTSGAGAAPPPSGRQALPSDLEPAWLARSRELPDRDRIDLSKRIGWAVPEFPAGADAPDAWYGTAAPVTWDELRGRIVVVQTFNSRGGTGIRRAIQAEELFGPANEDVTLLLMHTPEERASVLDGQITKNDIQSPIYMDRSGEVCDRFGAFRKPVVIVVDRHGIVRGTGLTHDGALELIDRLKREPFDPQRRGAVRPVPELRAGTGAYPPITGAVGQAKDVRGEKLHRLNISQWQTSPAPTLVNRILVIDFWATWCVQCIEFTPHMAALQREFPDEIVVIALTKESPDRFTNGMRKLGRTPKSFGVHIALDSGGLTGSSIFLQAIPHALVVGRDGVVRWQGHSSRLTADIIRQIIEAEGDVPELGRWAERLALQP